MLLSWVMLCWWLDRQWRASWAHHRSRIDDGDQATLQGWRSWPKFCAIYPSVSVSLEVEIARRYFYRCVLTKHFFTKLDHAAVAVHFHHWHRLWWLDCILLGIISVVLSQGPVCAVAMIMILLIIMANDSSLFHFLTREWALQAAFLHDAHLRFVLTLDFHHQASLELLCCSYI